MSIVLATTWYPRGELPRFAQLLPRLLEGYCSIVISYIPGIDTDVQEEFVSGKFASNHGVIFFENEDQKMGRYLAVKKALEAGADYIHYVDMDRLLRWVETRPDEWMQMLKQIEKFDCIIFGRTEEATHTHPQALIMTEKASNQVVSFFLEREMDVSAGSKSFSRAAAQYIIDHDGGGNSIGTDAEWPIRLKQAGFGLEYIQVNGLDWESADRFQPQAANAEQQKQAAAEYDADPEHWVKRVEIANQIIQTALEVGSKKHSVMKESNSQQTEFDVEAVFDVDDYLYFYGESLTDERTEAEVSALVRLLELDTPRKILDLACGFGRHANRLAAMGHTVTGIDLTPGFLEIARQEAMKRKVDVQYRLGDMRNINFDHEFDLVMLLFTSFGYFSDEVNQRILINARKALKPGGLLIFDSLNRDTLLKEMRPYFVVEKEGNMMIDRLSFDSLLGRFYNKRVVFKDGVRKDKPFFVRLYNPNEIKTLLDQAGLELHHIYAGWDGKEFSSDAHRMVVVARKPS
jgi:SAM-dependent methyltransferase